MKKVLFMVLLTIISIFIIDNVKADEVLFEDIGHYAFSSAGNNLADRGYPKGTMPELILDYPSNWNSIKSNIPANILSRITSISGSYLEYEGNILL